MNKNKILCFVLALLLTLGCFIFPRGASDFAVSAAGEVVEVKTDDLQYDIISEDDGKTTVTIFYYLGSDVKISVPETIEGYPVTAIEYSAFGDSKTLEYVELPSTVEYVSPGAFDMSTKLKEIAVSSSNKYFTCSNGVLYNKDMTTLITVPIGKSGNFTVPESVVTIGDLAFFGCYNLTSVKMYNNVLSIGQNAFENCWNLTYLKLSDNLQILGFRAIAGCNSLSEIHLPYSIKTFGTHALLGGKDSDDNLFYYFTNGIYYVKGSKAEAYVKSLHLPSKYLKAETRCITDINSNVTIYDSAGVFPVDKKLDLKVTVKPTGDYTALLPVRYNTLNCYQISFLQNGVPVTLSKECVIRFNGLPSNTIPTATKVYVVRGGALVEKTRAPQAAFVGTTFSGTDTFAVITNNNFTLKGDIDGDGVITIYDARFALCIAAGLVTNITNAQKTTADITGNGVKTDDATEILRYAAGIK